MNISIKLNKTSDADGFTKLNWFIKHLLQKHHKENDFQKQVAVQNRSDEAGERLHLLDSPVIATGRRSCDSALKTEVTLQDPTGDDWDLVQCLCGINKMRTR